MKLNIKNSITLNPKASGILTLTNENLMIIAKIIPQINITLLSRTTSKKLIILVG